MIKLQISSRNQNDGKNISTSTMSLTASQNLKFSFMRSVVILMNVMFWYSIIKCVNILVVLSCCTLPSRSPNCPKPKCYHLCFSNPLKTSLPYYSGVTVSFQYAQNLKQILQCHTFTFKKKKNQCIINSLTFPKPIAVSINHERLWHNNI